MNAKLEILAFDLVPYANKDIKDLSFNQFFKSKIKSSDLNKVYRKLVKVMDNPADSSYRVNGNKAFTLLSKNSGVIKDEEVIYGILKGGDIGDGKTKSSLRNRSLDENLAGNVINDKYFFLLYTPLKESRGYLFLQTYKDDGIKKAFVGSIMKELFSIFKEYKIPKPENFYPQKIKDDFAKNASVKEIKFTDKILSSSFSDESSFKSISNNFKVEVIITPVGGAVSTRIVDKMFSKIGLQKVGKSLKSFSRKNITVRNDITKKISHFELGSDFDDIKPRIYLDREKINYDNDNIPNFESLKEYCLELLQEIKDENDKKLKNKRRHDT